MYTYNTVHTEQSPSTHFGSSSPAITHCCTSASLSTSKQQSSQSSKYSTHTCKTSWSGVTASTGCSHLHLISTGCSYLFRPSGGTGPMRMVSATTSGAVDYRPWWCRSSRSGITSSTLCSHLHFANTGYSYLSRPSGGTGPVRMVRATTNGTRLWWYCRSIYYYRRDLRWTLRGF